MKPGCPSDLALEEYIIDPSLNDSAAHIAACDACVARLSSMEEVRQLFRRTVRPATLDSILRSTTHPARRWLQWLAPVLAVPALAAVVVMVRPHEVIHTKGNVTSVRAGATPSPLVLSVYADSDGHVHDGASVAAAAALKFRVEAATPCWLTIASVDSSGAVSHLYPDGAPATQLKPGAPVLPGGAILDGVVGPERLFAVCSEQPVQQDVIEKALRTAVNPRSLESAPATLPELPAGTLETTLLLHKVR